MNLAFSFHILEKKGSIKLTENPSSGGPVVEWGWTVGSTRRS